MLAEFLSRLEQEADGRVERAIVYGSRARGDASEWSDIDLLVVTDLGRERMDKISHGLETENFLSLTPLVMSPDEFDWYRRLRMPLYVNICRDGIELWGNDDTWQAECAAVTADFSREGERRQMSPETKETITIYIEDAHRCLSAMRDLESMDYLDFAASRGYYAVFNALSGALYSVNIVRAKHSGLKSAISQFLVQPGLVGEEYKDIYEALYRAREWGDYHKRDVEFTDDEIRQLLNDAERFVARMETFLKERQAL